MYNNFDNVGDFLVSSRNMSDDCLRQFTDHSNIQIRELAIALLEDKKKEAYKRMTRLARHTALKNANLDDYKYSNKLTPAFY